MSAHPTRLIHQATNNWVDARIHDLLGVDDLFDAEAEWAPARVRIRQRLARQRVPRVDWPGSLHWDWSKKAVEIQDALDGALSSQRLFGIDVGNEWQGLLLGDCTKHRCRIPENSSKDLVYVDYVEIAPWNWNFQKSGLEPRYKAIGPQLLDMAIRWSCAIGFKGRIGLHSLRQAERFYRDRCQMVDLGLDRNCADLRYFEMTESQAEKYLSRA